MTYPDPLELLSGDADPALLELLPKIFTKFISCVYYGQIGNFIVMYFSILINQ